VRVLQKVEREQLTRNRSEPSKSEQRRSSTTKQNIYNNFRNTDDIYRPTEDTPLEHERRQWDYRNRLKEYYSFVSLTVENSFLRWYFTN
jgi:hypothetical protein